MKHVPVLAPVEADRAALIAVTNGRAAAAFPVIAEAADLLLVCCPCGLLTGRRGRCNRSTGRRGGAAGEQGQDETQGQYEAWDMPTD